MTNREVVEAFWSAFDRFEFDAVGPLLADDFVLEWPQSGEVIRGRDNLIAVNKYYPGQWRIVIKRLVEAGDTAVTEIDAVYGDKVNTAVSFFTVQDGKIRHIREFWPDPMPAAEWRAQWVEQLKS